MHKIKRKIKEIKNDPKFKLYYDEFKCDKKNLDRHVKKLIKYHKEKDINLYLYLYDKGYIKLTGLLQCYADKNFKNGSFVFATSDGNVIFNSLRLDQNCFYNFIHRSIGFNSQQEQNLAKQAEENGFAQENGTISIRVGSTMTAQVSTTPTVTSISPNPSRSGYVNPYKIYGTNLQLVTNPQIQIAGLTISGTYSSNYIQFYIPTSVPNSPIAYQVNLIGTYYTAVQINGNPLSLTLS
jgi:hypothetical protein